MILQPEKRGGDKLGKNLSRGERWMKKKMSLKLFLHGDTSAGWMFAVTEVSSASTVKYRTEFPDETFRFVFQKLRHDFWRCFLDTWVIRYFSPLRKVEQNELAGQDSLFNSPTQRRDHTKGFFKLTSLLFLILAAPLTLLPLRNI